MKNRHDYAYAVGRVRALEARLIPESIFRSAIEAESASQALNIISESLHQEAVRHIRSSRDLELFLDEQMSQLNKAVTQLLDDEQLTSALFSLVENLASAEDKISKIKFEFFNNLLSHVINLEELTTYLRLNLSQNLSKFLPGDYGGIARKVSQAKQKEDSYLLLEKLKAAFILKFLSGAKYITFGPEPIISYYFAKLNEIKLLRWVILGKINQVPEDKLLTLI